MFFPPFYDLCFRHKYEAKQHKKNPGSKYFPDLFLIFFDRQMKRSCHFLILILLKKVRLIYFGSQTFRGVLFYPATLLPAFLSISSHSYRQ